MLTSEIQINVYDVLCCDRERHVACLAYLAMSEMNLVIILNRISLKTKKTYSFKSFWSMLNQ